MDHSWMESLLFGFISGLAEILPISAQAHRTVVGKLFGFPTDDASLYLFVHLGALGAVLYACRAHIRRIRRETQISRLPRGRKKRSTEEVLLMDWRLVKTAIIPALIGVLLYPLIRSWSGSLPITAGFLILNGLILILPGYFSTANKDSRSMNRLNSISIGMSAGLGVLPGVSGMAASTTVCALEGADRQHALNWCLLLSIPVLACFSGLDIIQMIAVSAGLGGALGLLQCVLAAAAAFCGAYIGIVFMRFLSVNLGYFSFAYYSWGAALFTFILYMTI